MVTVAFIFAALVGSGGAVDHDGLAYVQMGSLTHSRAGNLTSAGQGAGEECNTLGAACCQRKGSKGWCTGNWLQCDNSKNPTCVPCGADRTTCCSPDGRADKARAERDFCKDKLCSAHNSCEGDPCGGEGQTCCQKKGANLYGGSCADGLGCSNMKCYKTCGSGNTCGDGEVCIYPGGDNPNVCVRSGSCSCDCDADDGDRGGASCAHIFSSCSRSCYYNYGGSRHCQSRYQSLPIQSKISLTQDCNKEYEESYQSGCELSGHDTCNDNSQCAFSRPCACGCNVRDKYKIK